MASRRVPWRFRKYDMVMGIMGKTQGVKMAAKPNPKATSRNVPRLCVAVVAELGEAAAARAFGGPVNSMNPAGMAAAAERAAGSTVRLAVAVRRTGGIQKRSLQVW